ncbi:MAG: thioredoxin family protein [Anaerolineae bacterium]
MKMKVEFFSAECKLCERTLNILKYNFPALEIDVHKASECRDGGCCALAGQYGVQAVPSLVVDGKVALVGLPDGQDIKSLATILQR